MFHVINFSCSFAIFYLLIFHALIINVLTSETSGKQTISKISLILWKDLPF